MVGTLPTHHGTSVRNEHYGSHTFSRFWKKQHGKTPARCLRCLGGGWERLTGRVRGWRLIEGHCVGIGHNFFFFGWCWQYRDGISVGHLSPSRCSKRRQSVSSFTTPESTAGRFGSRNFGARLLSSRQSVRVHNSFIQFWCNRLLRMVQIVVTNEAARGAPLPSMAPGVRRASASHQLARHLASTRRLMLIWIGAVLTPWILQVRSYVNLVMPHKISQDLLELDLERQFDGVLTHCPVKGLYIASIWWNILPTHYGETISARVCHFVVPQYNMHGAYHLTNNHITTASNHSSSSCRSNVVFVDYYFYHGSVGYNSLYEEGEGTVCMDDWTAVIKVKKLGSFDLNGQLLAEDRGATGYRQSYWFGTVGLILLAFRALVLHRSFVMFKRYIDRCETQRIPIHVRDVVVFIQESARLTAHDATNLQRIGVLYLLVEAFMADLFVLITTEGVFALVQCISLCYNLAGMISILFEMIETSSFFRSRCPRFVRTSKRLLYSSELTMIGELLLVTGLQTYITTLNHSKLQDTQHVALAISYYAWGLLGHAIVAATMIFFLFLVRSIGAVIVIWHKFRTLEPLTAPCSVEYALGVCQKLILLSGYCWNDKTGLIYSKTSLAAYGIMAAKADNGFNAEQYIVSERIGWIASSKGVFVTRAVICGQQLAECVPQTLVNAATRFCDRDLGGPLVSRVQDVSSTPEDVELGAGGVQLPLLSAASGEPVLVDCG